MLPSAKSLSELIARLWRRYGFERVRLMHVCGTHEHTITYHGLRALMPEGLELIPGPGCPVCVTPARVIDEAIRLCLEGVTIYTYGDMYRVPGTQRSLADARREGCRAVVVYGFLDAARLARENRGEAVFLGVGFETTAPTTAAPIARGSVPDNLYVLPSYRLTAPGLNHALRLHRSRGLGIDGVIAPGHVSAIIGAEAWRYLPREYGLPVVVSGFEPEDVLLSIAILLRMIGERRPGLVNEYSRVVKPLGNRAAWRTVMEVYRIVDAYWRGIGVLPESGLLFREKYRAHDAIERYGLDISPSNRELHPACRCGEVSLGLAYPTDCPLFMKACRPGRPIGPCMVSSEGACSIWARYGGWITAASIGGRRGPGRRQRRHRQPG